jgi:hypothetical protein
MKGPVLFLFFALLICSGTLSGQDKRAFLMSSAPLPENRSVLRNNASKNPLFSPYKLPQGAIFCRMEEHLWRKYNVWFKLRAGNDEMYRKLIGSK